MKTVLTGKFMATRGYINKQETFQISKLALQLKKLEKEQTKLKDVRRKELMKISAEINKIEN